MNPLLLLAMAVVAVSWYASSQSEDGSDPDAGTSDESGFGGLWDRVTSMGADWRFASATARKRGIDNATTDPQALRNLDKLWQALTDTFGADTGWRVTNAFRSPALNDALRAEGYKVATNSLHMQGRAADVAPPPGMSLDEMELLAAESGRFVEIIPYPDDGHLHLAVRKA